MVTRKTTMKRRAPARRPAERAVPMPKPAAPPVWTENMKAGFKVAGRAMERAGKAASQFARASMHEMTLAGRASREPMQAMWRAMRLAGRHIARDAVAAWHEAVPTAARARKPAPHHAAS